MLGAATAIAVLSKFTALLYLPAAAALTLLFYFVVKRPSPRRIGGMVRERVPTLVMAVLAGAVIIWAGYWFSFGRVPGWGIKLPAPEFFDGLAVANAHNQRGHPSYLLGKFSLKGWWYYFPVALAVKTPLAF